MTTALTLAIFALCGLANLAAVVWLDGNGFNWFVVGVNAGLAFAVIVEAAR